MASRFQLQVQVAKEKEKNPNLFCPTRKCLWKTFDGSYCPRHNPIPWLEKTDNGISINDRL